MRVVLDDRVDQSFGRRVTDWELKGVPLRLELGPRDLAEGKVTVVRRDTGEKSPVALDGVGTHVDGALAAIQDALLAEARDRLARRTVDAADLDEARAAAQDGFARIGWDAMGRDEGEATLAEAGVTVRCLQRPDGALPLALDAPDLVAHVSRAY